MGQRVSCPVLVGRGAEVARLRAAIERAAAGQPATVLVAGEAGIGKTRLVTEAAGYAAGLGVVALAGGCLDVGEGVLAYAPVVEALRPLAGLLGPGELERVLDGAGEELARLVPELGSRDTARRAGQLEPSRLFELLLGMLHRIAERAPVLLVAEDLHWADQSTRDLLAFLVRNLRAGVALVLTCRSDEPRPGHPLGPFLAELSRGGRAERLELGRLGRRELTELVAGILGEPPSPSLAREILARAEGNPFFAEELLAARREGTRMPPALRDLLLARVDALPESAQRVLEAAAVAGSRVDHELLAAATGRDGGQLVPLLREAVARHLLAVDEGNGGYMFRHALVQEAVYGELLPVQRAPLHAAYARALDRRIGRCDADAGGTAVELAQLAYHWQGAGDQGQALPSLVRAGQAAELAAAPAEALEHYQRALDLWEQAPAARWTRSRCCTVRPRRRTSLAVLTWRWPSPPGRWARSTRPPSRCGPGCCWSGSATTTGSPRTDSRRWPRSRGRWPWSRPTRRRGSGRACWPLMAASSCWWGPRRRLWPAARRRSPWPGTWAREPRRLTP
jgi:predicted ATPase